MAGNTVRIYAAHYSAKAQGLLLTPHQYHKKGGQPPCGRTLLRPTHRAGSNAAHNVQRLLKKCARDWNGCAAKKMPVSSNRYFFAGRAGAMESPTRAVVEPAETKARVAPKQVASCGAYQLCHSGRSLRLLTEFAFANSQKIDY